MCSPDLFVFCDSESHSGLKRHVSSKAVEGYVIMNSDMPKDSATEVSHLAMIMDWTAHVLKKRDLPMPHHCVIEDLPQSFLSWPKETMWHSNSSMIVTCKIQGE